MLRQVLRVTSEDAGERRVLRDVMGAPCRAWNSRGFITAVEYDEARRPLRTIVTRPDTSTFTAVRIVYGEAVASPESSNLRGRVFRVYDGAGLLQSDAFDFAGNLGSQTRRLTVAYDATPSWSDLDGLTDVGDLDTAAATLLEAETFVTTATFDALGRPVTQTTPDDSVTQLGYDDGGKLYSVSANIEYEYDEHDYRVLAPRRMTGPNGEPPWSRPRRRGAEGPSSEVRTSSPPLRGAFVRGPHLVAPPSRGLRPRSAPRRPPFEGHPSEVRTSSSPLREGVALERIAQQHRIGTRHRRGPHPRPFTVVAAAIRAGSPRRPAGAPTAARRAA